MRGRQAGRLALLWLVAIAGCAARAIAPLTAPQNDFAQPEDETALLERANRFEADVDSRALVMRDPELQAYLDGVLARVAPKELGQRAPRVLVLRSSLPTAYTLPNGTIYVSTAILVTMQSEAQLAQVLGHETSHYVKRHALRSKRDHDAKAIAAGVANIAALGIPVANGAYLAAVTSYGRDLEEEADRDGLEWMAAAGYDPEAAVEVYTRLEQALGPQAQGGSIYDTHPSLQTRTRYARELISSGAVRPAASPLRREAEHRAAVDPVRRANVELLLDAKRFAAAEEEADESIAAMPGTAVFHCYKGEAKRGAADDPEFAAVEAAARSGTELTDASIAAEAARVDERRREALADYERCLAIDPNEALGHRGIGIVSRQTGDTTRAVTSLQRYLQLAPAAYDRRWILLLLGPDSSS